MTNFRFIAPLLAIVLVLSFATGCARDTADAGVKPIGVGFDPGDLFPGPEARGGLVDVGLYNTRGTNIDFGVTGFFGSSGAFMDVDDDPWDALLGWGWFFSPALTAADEYAALSPKGPDLEDACFVQRDTNGPLGSFDTVDVGDEMVFTNGHEDPALRTEFVTPRNPQDYPVNTSSVFIYYVGTAPLRLDDELLADNWTFGEDIQMTFTGALPPENAPVPSIPQPSDVEDDRVGKEAGHPTVFSPDELTGVRTSNRIDEDGQVPVRFAPTGGALPDPRGNDGVLHVTWDAPTTEDSDAVVTIAILLLSPDEPYLVSDPFGNPEFCVPAEPLDTEAFGGRTDAWFIEYANRKQVWCDEGFEPDMELGNDEFGLDSLGEDTCHNEIDDNEDGFCDEGGCVAEDGVTWFLPDPNCARHTLTTATCGTDGHCREVGGDRDPDGHLAQLLCTATDDGDFVVPADMVDSLLETFDAAEIAGAVLKVARTSETLIDVPMVRDQVGNQQNINPVRLRASQVHFGRFDWE
jgi:hypothetical protein